MVLLPLLLYHRGEFQTQVTLVNAARVRLSPEGVVVDRWICRDWSISARVSELKGFRKLDRSWSDVLLLATFVLMTGNES